MVVVNYHTMPLSFRMKKVSFVTIKTFISRTFVDNTHAKVKTGIMMVSRYNHDGSFQHGVTTFLPDCKGKKRVE